MFLLSDSELQEDRGIWHAKRPTAIERQKAILAGHAAPLAKPVGRPSGILPREAAERALFLRLAATYHRSTRTTTARFVPVRVTPAPTRSIPLELVLASGRVVRVPCGFDADTLRQLLAVLHNLPEDALC
jgi:hypothetical protein